MNKILLVIILELFGLFGNKKTKDTEFQFNEMKDALSFEMQLQIFEELGYKLNKSITKQDLLKSAN